MRLPQTADPPLRIRELTLTMRFGPHPKTEFCFGGGFNGGGFGNPILAGEHQTHCRRYLDVPGRKLGSLVRINGL